VGIIPEMQASPATITNIVSIDVEDWFQVENFSQAIQQENWDSYPLRIERNVQRILEICDRTGVRATFFILGWVAERLPHLVRQLAGAGHEVASHGWSHAPVWRLTPDEFRGEVSRSRKLLEDLSGGQVFGYRAPTFSITSSTLWALDILAEEGYLYDSSIFPVWHDHYGIPDAPLEIHQGKSGLWEVPLSVLDFGGARLPVAGGGYFRLYPRWVTEWAIGRINRAGRPAVIYLHPWEFDPGQPEPPGVSRVKLLRHRIGLQTTGPRLARLFDRFRFAPARDVLAAAGAQL
jgi:polysaccharide deacetylase family protein (PEP-CTERM system associated)